MILYKKGQEDSGTILQEKNGVAFFQFDSYLRMPWITHCFTTRVGGVSTGCFSSMNLGYGRGESCETVTENYRRLGAAVGFDWTKVVLSHQTHTTNVRLVTEADAGKGTVRERDYRDTDGLITDVPGLPLVTFYADCVPLYFVDSRHHAIGLSHSGWRGTAGRMGQKTLEAMREAFGTLPEDVRAVIGPSICGDCFEVGPEVLKIFEDEFGREKAEEAAKPGAGDRLYLDLWKLNRLVLREAGVPDKQIAAAGVCTRCNPDLLYSHRLTGNRRGNLAAVLMIRE